MAITANQITARAITANAITAYPIDGSGGGDCPLTFENGILNGGRVLCSGQLLIGSSDGTPYVDSEDWVDPENWND